MSFKEIKELRQAGKLDEALKMANQALEAEPDNIWNKRAAVWVYYDYLKKYAQPDSFEAFKENLIKIKDLQLPEDEKMVFDNCAWQIGSLVFGLQKAESVDYGRVNELFEIIRDFHFTKPSEAYSFIYKAFHKGYQNWSSYLTFADWWNLENLSSEDFIKEEFKGKKMMSIAEQAYIAYSKKLLEGEPFDSFGQQRVIDKEKIQSFLPKLDSFIEKHPEYQYPPYYKAKLLLALGDRDDVLSNFLPFAKKKRNDFWVWELLSDIYPSDDVRKLACLCKALSLKTPGEFVINTRQKLAEILVKQNKFKEAKTEIERIIQVRSNNSWKIPKQIAEWTDQNWYKSTLSFPDNVFLYKQYVKSAEEILFAGIPEETIVIEFINENKSLISFVKNRSIHGFFNYSGLIENPQIGDLIKVRFHGSGSEGFYKVLSINKASNDSTCDAIKDFQGNLRMKEPAIFGFVDDVFIDSNLIVKNELNKNDMIKGKAILSFNKKKSDWGWKAISVEQIK